ncbi:MAG: tail fiber domain-containing protein [Cyanomargarita calcarea GSE-NOS-MK-12-04C]|jgi:hypothetical protein|uniref:Tail fiber domain-containing protein n=1 Tax=Cyanomargarita calcarea GSE-NOS-MK-12-04C TaxID=2839659 RepID=A0A951UVM6_9CYAN|nr:tail fiber domain-containing protein [Cyanomargarita calcarea GSE-NOS-MK-12-04C]
MKGDFTRSTFKAEKHYNGVRMQQGRLQLDADWNEQVDIQNHINQSLTQDLIGDSGAAKSGDGFKISIKAEATDKDLTIAAGHIYVNGILCELEEPTTYTVQPDYPNPPKLDNGSYLAYLDVWERHITAIEDQKILEPALKGLDTATRTKTIWQVKLISAPKDLSEGKIEEWIKTWKSPDGGSLNQDSKAYLTAATADGISAKDLINPNKKNYRGSENQLYRVEIHTSGDINTAKFKWSRNNGTTVSAIDSIKGNSINLVNIGRDDLQSFKVNQWVEILDEEQELKNEPGMLLRLQKAFNTQLDVIGNPVESQFSGKKKLKVRGWHDTDKQEIPVSDTDKWFEIENGIYIKFDENSNYKTGDYWLIPARAVTKDIDWDYDKSGERKKERSHGIQHHYSPLALVKYENEKFTEVKDYRQTFPPLKNVLDKTGDIMTGDLEIQANLYVTRKLVNSEFIPGKVGIGTTTPFQQLIIDSTGKVGIGYNEANQTAGLAIRDNVGIGTFDPKQQLIINSGKVGIGYNETNQTAGLAIRGNVGIGTFDPKQQLIINSGKVGIGYNEPNQTAGLAIRDNVGIGTFDPKQQLIINSGKVGIGYNEANQTAGLAIRDNVGIGTFDPKQQLIINSGKVGIGYNEANQTAGLAIRDNVGIGTFDPKQQLIINSGKVGIGYNEANQTAGLAIRDNVGIGTTQPNALLDIKATTKDGVKTPFLVQNPEKSLFAIKDDGKVGIGIDNPEQKLVINNGKVGIGYNDSTQTATLAIKENVGIGTPTPNALLNIKTLTKDGTKTSLLVENSDSNLFAIKDDGKVGIGIDSPEQKLVINNGKVGIGYNEANQTAALAIRDNLGIGTFDPSALLEIQATTKNAAAISFLVQNSERSLFAIKNDGNIGIGVVTPEQKLVINEGKVSIGYNDSTQTAALAIQDNVGIGTTKPNALLDIKTATKDGIETSFLVQNPDRALLTVKDDGKVGIGISQPKAKLEIEGVVPTFGTGQIKSDRANKITGIQTKFQQELHIGDTITVDTQPRIITNIDDDNSLTVNVAFDPDLPSDGTTFTYQSPILNLLDSVGKTQMIVTNGGNVSIGNTFPNTNAKLFLDGDLRVNGKLLQNSSRELKENITKLSSQEALETLNSLEPVKFTYKDSPDPKIHVGFISEDVPNLLTSSDNTSVSPVDIAAVLTKAVKDQQVTISLLVHALKEHQKQISTLVEKVRVLESRN